LHGHARFRSKSISRGSPVLGQALDSYGGKTLLIGASMT
jgi:hypothetical protein